jgi:hypothetical protein
VATSELGELGILGDELVEAAFDVQAFRDTALEELAPCGGKASSLRRDADNGSRRVEGDRIVNGPDDRNPLLRLSRSSRWLL